MSWRDTRPWTVMITRPNGNYQQVYRNESGNLTTHWRRARSTTNGYVWRAGTLTTDEKNRAVAWAKREGWKHTIYRGRRYPYLTLKTGEKWPTDNTLLNRMNELGRFLNRRIHTISGHRTWAQQNYYYQLYLAGRGAPANHPDRMDDHRLGVAADCGVIGADGRYWNIGEHPKIRVSSHALLHRFGLCLPYRPPHSYAHARTNAEIWHLGLRKRPKCLPTQQKKGDCA